MISVAFCAMFLRATREGYKIHFFPHISIKYRVGTGVSSSQMINIELLRDIERMFYVEIESLNITFNFLEKGQSDMVVRRLRQQKKQRRIDFFRLIVKYPDVVVYRLLFSR